MKSIALAFCLFVLVPNGNTADRKPLRLGELYWLLDRACVSGDEFSAQILLEAGADPSGPRGYTDFHKHLGRGWLEPTWPLVQASHSGHPAITRLLLRAGADPDLVCGEADTALNVAVEKGNIEIVRLLLAAGAKKKNKDVRESAEEVAERCGHPETLDLLRASK